MRRVRKETTEVIRQTFRACSSTSFLGRFVSSSLLKVLFTVDKILKSSIDLFSPSVVHAPVAVPPPQVGPGGLCPTSRGAMGGLSGREGSDVAKWHRDFTTTESVTSHFHCTLYFSDDLYHKSLCFRCPSRI